MKPNYQKIMVPALLLLVFITGDGSMCYRNDFELLPRKQRIIPMKTQHFLVF